MKLVDFKMNENDWKIVSIDKQYLIDRYNSEHEEKCYYAFGLTDYPKQTIYINEELDEQLRIRTMIHELTHCYLWEYGINQANFSEEDVCNFVSATHRIIIDILTKYYAQKEKDKQNN